MIQASAAYPIPAIARVLQAYLQTGWRGPYRTTFTLARFLKSLQTVPITIADWPPVYMDMRFRICHDWLRENPLPSSPRETDEQAVMNQVVKPGDIVFDIGANFGLHAVLLSRLIGETGHLVAFEPNSEIFPALSRTIAGLNNATLYPYALSDESLDSDLFIPPHNPDVASLGNWTEKEYGPIHTVVCQQRRIDDLVASQVLPAPDFIKCDVEGAEFKVFQGAFDTLNRTDAPIILFEANCYTVRGFGATLSAAKDFLEALVTPHYQMFEVRQGGQLVACETLNPVHSNILAIPESRLSRLLGHI